MNIEKYIQQILTEQNELIVPGLGSFTKTEKTPEIMHIESKMTPPGSLIGFNSNISLNDGVLERYISEKENISNDEAKVAIANFVSHLWARLHKKEFVNLSGIGRLYEDFEQNLQFLPDKSNLNKSSYGLPEVEAKPVLQHKTADDKKIATTTTISASVKGKSTFATWIRKNLIWILSTGLIIAMTCVLIIFLYPDPTPGKKLEDDRINVSPEYINNEDKGTVRMDGDEPVYIEEDNDEATTGGEIEMEKVARLGVAKLSKKANVDNLVQKLYEEGFQPYTEKIDNLTRVGILLTYDKEEDVVKTLEQIRKKFAPDAEILSLDGE